MATCIDLEDDVTCCICVELFTDPVMLPCMHTLCNKCALQIRGRTSRASFIQCPLCQATCRYSQLRKDFNKRKLVDIYQAAADRASATELGVLLPDVKSCGFCDDSGPSWKCAECAIFLCEKCKIGHSKLPVCKDHNLQKIDPTAEITSIEKLTAFEQKLMLVKEQCEDCSNKLDEYSLSITRQLEDFTTKISDYEDDLLQKIRNKFKQESDKGIDALQIESDVIGSYSTDLERKQTELTETLTVIRNVIQEHTSDNQANLNDPFLLDVLNQAENVHNELKAALSTFNVPKQKLFVSFERQDLSHFINAIEARIEKKSGTHDSEDISPVSRTVTPSTITSRPVDQTSSVLASNTSTVDDLVTELSGVTARKTAAESVSLPQNVAVPKRRTRSAHSFREATKQPLPPPRPPPPYSVAVASTTQSIITETPTSPVRLSTSVPTSSIFPGKLRRSGKKSQRRPINESQASSNRELQRSPPARTTESAGNSRFFMGSNTRQEGRASNTPSTMQQLCESKRSSNQLIMDSPVPVPLTASFFIGTPTLSSFMEKPLVKQSIFMCEKRPSRIHAIDEKIWIVLEDGTLTVLNPDGSFVRNMTVHVSNHGDGVLPCATSAVTSATNGDIIAACTGFAIDIKDPRQMSFRPGLCIVNSDGQCLHVISNDSFLDVSKGTEAIHALRKSDRNVTEYRFQENNWIFIRKIELVPTTQYTRLISHGEFLYASSVLPDLIHKVHLQSCRIKTLGFRGSGLPGELRSPRVSCADDDGVVLVTDYWNNRMQVFTVDNSFYILNIEEPIAGPQDALLDTIYGSLFVLSYVDRNLYCVRAEDHI